MHSRSRLYASALISGEQILPSCCRSHLLCAQSVRLGVLYEQILPDSWRRAVEARKEGLRAAKHLFGGFAAALPPSPMPAAVLAPQRVSQPRGGAGTVPSLRHRCDRRVPGRRVGCSRRVLHRCQVTAELVTHGLKGPDLALVKQLPK